MKLKRLEKDSGEWESRIHETGSGLMLWSCERGQVLPCAVGERETVSWMSWRMRGKKGWLEERGHVSETQMIFSTSAASNPSRQTEKLISNSSEFGPETRFALSWIDWVELLCRLGLEIASGKTSCVGDSFHSSVIGSSHIHGHMLSMFFG